MKDKQTKQQVILGHLKRGWRLSNDVAFFKYGYTRLGSIIYELRQDGYNIETIMRTDSEGQPYAEYRLIR